MALQKWPKSRLSSIFSPKPSHWTDFHIELDDFTRVYGPSDTVKGAVVLNVSRPLGITHIVVRLFGYVQVFKNPSKPKGDNPSHGNTPQVPKGSRWTNEYYGDGYASLFEDEVVLCGGGRLDPGTLHFKFELKFPKAGAPSSIEFERGTVAYVVTSTLTRPTAISPQVSCERRIHYRDEIDVSRIAVPKPFVVDLKPIYPHVQRAKTHAKQFAASHSKHKRSSLLSRTDTDVSIRTNTSTTTRDDEQSQRPPSPSIASTHSRSSGKVKDHERDSERRSSQTSQNVRAGGSNPGKMILASVQLSKGACLPGETIPLTVSIKHTKVVTTLSGVIVTFYRQAGVDMHPNLPIGPREQNGKTKYEDYYPRSRTGLGGLSLSAAGSSQLWRKDLSQTVKPLYIDPETLTADIKMSIPVPEDAFPSIRNVPGDMITFKYYVEVIIDIQGKLGQSGSFPSLGMTENQSNLATNQLQDAAGRPVMVMWEGGCMNTNPLVRDKTVLTCVFDMVVGTRDSVRSRGKQRAEAVPPPDTLSNGRETAPTAGPSRSAPASNADARHTNHSPRQEQRYDQNDYYGPSYGYDGYDDGYAYGYGYGYEYGYDPGHDYYSQHYPQWYPYYQHPPYPPYPPAPQPNIPNEDELPEKERLRRAEERLLPSQPPAEDGPSATTVDLEPTAPFIPEESALFHPGHEERILTTRNDVTPSSVPTLEDSTPSNSRPAEQLTTADLSADQQVANSDLSSSTGTATAQPGHIVQSSAQVAMDELSEVTTATEYLPRYER